MRRALALLRVPGPTTVHRLAVASVVANVAIVVTGGAVRLTGSGLGCPVWPTCTEESWTPTGEYGIHGVIEFGNRLLTYVLGLVALLTLIAAWRTRPVRRDWRALAVGLFVGIPAQAVLGGVTVLTGLNPWVVMLHFLLSMVLIAAATVLVRRTREEEAPARLLVPRALQGLGYAVLAVLAAVLYLGTVVTGSGPHAGDDDSPRTGLDVSTMAHLHADAVFLLIGLTAALLVGLVAVQAPAPARRAAAMLLGLELAQGVVGYAQYFLGLPVLLVGLHLLGAALLVVAAVRVVLSLREHGEADVEPMELPAATAVPAGR